MHRGYIAISLYIDAIVNITTPFGFTGSYHACINFNIFYLIDGDLEKFSTKSFTVRKEMSTKTTRTMKLQCNVLML